LNLAGWVKKLSGVPTITVGSVGLDSDFINAFVGEGAAAAPIDGLVQRLDDGEFDLVGVGRALLANPDWANKVRDGHIGDLNAYSKEDLSRLT
jgi:2,4-dienoyl-CoA reductase-like NADH-dependent reductase (Old Yellow Enzyme family)